MSLYVDIKKDLGSFTLETKFEADGGVTGILGASGCGKSMTLRCIAGILKPDAGRIELDGTVFFDSEKKIDLKPQQRHVGLLFQNYALFPNMTVRQNLMTGLMPYEKDKKKAAEAIQSMIGKFCLDGLEKHKPSQLSGGQQQRVALARIFLSSPRILLLDEPFSALDDFLKWKLELELAELLEGFAGSTLFVSHSREEIYRVCDRVCVMEQGKSSPVIPVKQLFEDPKSRAAAVLSGCKNFSRAYRAGEGCLYAQDWGVALEYAGDAPEDLDHIGVRSHYIHPVPAEEARGQKNTFCCEILRIVEDVFSTVAILRPKDAGADADVENGRIRVEMTKEVWQRFRDHEKDRKEMWVHMDSKDIMVLGRVR
ncbi:MAG: ATP-binding cassette domain-containing protein [Lachnospiraceae bacterium]|jgi:molybdate transport system ATP-binding protein|nr:ATP-binding cassette domain-containing protein [Lachnospiraceae bacterium]